MKLKQSSSLKKPKKISLLLKVLSFFLLVIGISSAGGADKDLGGKKLITITKDNNGQSIEIEKGDMFRIELEELGSAGYRWHIAELDQDFLDLVSQETRDVSKGRIGAPVKALWLIKSKKTGKTKIALDHYRIWEGKESASEHFSVTLIIR